MKTDRINIVTNTNHHDDTNNDDDTNHNDDTNFVILIMKTDRNSLQAPLLCYFKAEVRVRYANVINVNHSRSIILM